MNSSFTASGPVTESYRGQNVHTLAEAINWTHRLRYRRNSRRDDYLLIFTEKQGTCSTKHAALAALCRENDIDGQLMLAICKLTTQLDPRATEFLRTLNVDYFPEAHCYLRYREDDIDVTFPRQSTALKVEILQQHRIEPEQIGDHKVALHHAYLQHWMAAQGIDQRFSFDEIWAMREAWITSLGGL